MSSGTCYQKSAKIKQVLGSTFHNSVVKWPQELERHAISHRFNLQRQLPFCIGAIDGTLIRTFGYNPNRDERNTRKCHYGFNLVIICDDQGLIRAAFHGEPGSQADSSILRRSEWFKNIDFLDLRQFKKKLSHFNAKVHTARAVIERVNGMLKNRYQCIRETVRCTKEDNDDMMIRPVVALHNYSILNGSFLEANSAFNNIGQLQFPSFENYIDIRDWVFKVTTQHINN